MCEAKKKKKSAKFADDTHGANRIEPKMNNSTRGRQRVRYPRPRQSYKKTNRGKGSRRESEENSSFASEKNGGEEEYFVIRSNRIHTD